jgi:hypothetical protein
MAVYAIPNLPVYSPLAGIADLYKEYKGIQRQEAQDTYAKEKDAKGFSLQEQELAAARDRMAFDAELAGRRMQHEGALQQAKLDWDKDPNNPENKYKLGTLAVAQQTAKRNAAKDEEERQSMLAFLNGSGGPGVQTQPNSNTANLDYKLGQVYKLLGGQ